MSASLNEREKIYASSNIENSLHVKMSMTWILK
jgi:hypothetical protein